MYRINFSTPQQRLQSISYEVSHTSEVVVKLNYSISDEILLTTFISSIKEIISSHYPDVSSEIEDAFMQVKIIIICAAFQYFSVIK